MDMCRRQNFEIQCRPELSEQCRCETDTMDAPAGMRVHICHDVALGLKWSLPFDFNHQLSLPCCFCLVFFPILFSFAKRAFTRLNSIGKSFGENCREWTYEWVNNKNTWLYIMILKGNTSTQYQFNSLPLWKLSFTLGDVALRVNTLLYCASYNNWGVFFVR